MGTNGKNRPYGELGKVLDALARERNVRGPYNIAYHMGEVLDYEVSGQAMSKYMYGESLPKPKFVEAFAEAFELTSRERMMLAWPYAYGSRLDLSMLDDGQDRKQKTMDGANHEEEYAAAVERCEKAAKRSGHVLGRWYRPDEHLHAAMCDWCGSMAIVVRQGNENRWRSSGKALEQGCLEEEDRGAESKAWERALHSLP